MTETRTAKRITIARVRGLLNRNGLNYDTQVSLRTTTDGVEIRAYRGSAEKVASVLAGNGREYRARRVLDDPRSAAKDYTIFTVTA